MKLFLATKLTVEQCTQRLHNAIDPIPPAEERMNSAKTIISPDPLPDAGRRTTGFGYSPGSRPVVGRIQAGKFRLEKRIVLSNTGNGRNAPPAIDTCCDGQLQPAPYGTLIELEMERQSSGIVAIFAACFFAIVFGLVAILVLYSYLTGMHAAAPPTRGAIGGFGSCMFVMIFAIPMVLSLIVHQTGQAEREYLTKFVKQVCRAVPLEAQGKDPEGYTGKTQRLP